MIIEIISASLLSTSFIKFPENKLENFSYIENKHNHIDIDKIVREYKKRNKHEKTFAEIFKIRHSPFSHLTVECNREIKDGNKKFYSDSPLDFNIQYQILIKF